MSVKKPTVVSMIEKLSQDGLLFHEKYGDVLLTERGIQVAQDVYRRHVAIYSFLSDILDVPQEIAEEDACNMEHHMSESTIDKLIKFIEFFQFQMYQDGEAFVGLKKYLESGKYQGNLGNGKSAIMKLIKVIEGNSVRILSVKDKGRAQNELFSDGLTPGTVAVVVSNRDNRRIIELKVNDRVLSIEKDWAESIVVEVIPFSSSEKPVI